MTYPVHMLNDLLAAVKAIETDAFDRGRAEQRETGKNTPLAQINRMSRQIDECHATIRNRNQKIGELNVQILALKEVAAMAKAEERKRIIERFEACLCFEKYKCEDKRCTDIMAFIALVKGETN